jgi:excisionase family DNA binding protein
VQADAIDAQAQMLEAESPLAPRLAEPAPLLSKQQLAAALGVSTAKVDRLCRDGAIPFLTVGDSRRFDPISVRAALEARAAEQPTPLPQPAPEAAASGVRRLSRPR